MAKGLFFKKLWGNFSNFFKAIRFNFKNRSKSPSYSFEKMDQGHICINCGLEFKGLYCPRCSQSANTSRFSFKSIFNGILEVFDYNNKSVLKTIIDLCYRPGYMIRDYLEGRRASYYPPIKLLFFVCVLLAILLSTNIKNKSSANESKKTEEVSMSAISNQKDTISLSNTALEGENQSFVDTSKNDTTKSSTASVEAKKIEIQIGSVVNRYKNWTKENRAMHVILSILTLSLCAYLVFKSKPPKLNSVEHFYALIYIYSALIFFSIIYILIFRDFDESDIYALPFFISFAYFVVVYKQLYRLKWFTTIVRVALSMLLNIILLGLIIVIAITIFVAIMGSNGKL